MKGKIVVVTGGSSGIGKETAKDIAKRGATIVLACRHMGKCEKVAVDIRQASNNSHVVCRFVDLANFDSITMFASLIYQELAHVDVLINNAGVMKPRPPKTAPDTDDGFERQFGVNHLGHFLLTNLLMDLLTNGEKPGRIINVTSESHKNGKLELDDIQKSSLEGDDRLNELYYQSKLANVYFTDSLDRLAASKYEGKVTANCLNPGICDTNIGRYSNTPLYSPILLLKPLYKLGMRTARQGAQTSIHLASDPNKDQVSGRYYDDCEEIGKTCEMCDKELGEQLWLKSEEWTNLKERLDQVKDNSTTTALSHNVNTKS